MGIFTKLTPFQLALVLMLLVAVPFLIAMITVYIVYGVTASKSERCEALCCYAKMKMRKYEPTTDFLESINNTDHPDYYDILTNPEDSETTTIDYYNIANLSEEQAEEILETKFVNWAHSVGAILAKSKPDTPDDEYKYECPGALITSTWMLTTGDCGRKDVVAVRIGSKSWAESGNLTQIVDKVFSEPKGELALLKINEVPPSAINIQEVDKKNLIQIVTWRENKIEFRVLDKEQTMETLKLTFERNVDCMSYMTTDRQISCFAAKPVTKPLETYVGVILNNFGKLIGFHLKTICEDKDFCVVIFFKTSPYKGWIERITKSDN